MTTIVEPTLDAELLDIRAVAALQSCSTRHIARMQDAGDMPRALRLGRLLRWRRAELLEWIAAGCPSPRKTGWKLDIGARS